MPFSPYLGGFSGRWAADRRTGRAGLQTAATAGSRSAPARHRRTIQSLASGIIQRLYRKNMKRARSMREDLYLNIDSLPAAWIPAGRFTAIKGSAYYVVAWTAALAEMDYRRRGGRRCPPRGWPLCI